MTDTSGEGVFPDRISEDALAKETVTTDGVAGETVLDGAGDGNDGPTGGAPKEGTPTMRENDLADEPIDLAEQPEDE